MIGRIETMLRQLRRKLSRTHWLMRLLHLSVTTGEPNQPGLVMVQIDGLSLQHFQRAIDAGNLPFLQRLIQREHYQTHSHYSGLPSSTPAVQAELFYGIKTAVPAFAFLDREKGKIVRMYEPEAALEVEEELKEQLTRDGILSLCSGGSSYSNNFTGGADLDEAHFCASSLGWGSTLRAANPFALLFLIVSNINSVIRIVILLVVELVIAVIDCIRGLFQGLSLIKELKFIPARVAICILLRELCVIGGKVDIQRGLPIVHINFLGYDEQSHRRGPGSKFAHWTLKGIDNAIERLWKEAIHAPRRHYEVWIYSDHGQSRATSFSKLQGCEVVDAVRAVYAGLEPAKVVAAGKRKTTSVEIQRARLLGFKKPASHLLLEEDSKTSEDEGELIQVAGLGPVGFIYFPSELQPAELEHVARTLAQEYEVPAVVIGRETDQLRVWTADGEFMLPQQVEELFGADHPFIDEIGEDLTALCRHPHAGDLTLLGWRKGVKPITFASENGSHAGLTPDETNAFSLLPPDAPLPQTARNYYRPQELRLAALSHLGRTSTELPASATLPTQRKRSPLAQTDQLRIMTYNVHSCVGIDGKLDVERIARVIARAKPDVVALQELDVGRARTGGMDQAEKIAQYLNMEFHFHPSIHLEEEKYGDAILTNLPMKLIKADALPDYLPGSKLEPRGALWVTVDVQGTEVNIINTHLGLAWRERALHIKTLLGADWLGSLTDELVVFCGDFNCGPSSKAYRELCGRFSDAQVQLEPHKPKGTFYSRVPGLRIDHVFINPGIRVTAITIPRTELTMMASDHLPLIADLSVAHRVNQKKLVVVPCRVSN